MRNFGCGVPDAAILILAAGGTKNRPKSGHSERLWTAVCGVRNPAFRRSRRRTEERRDDSTRAYKGSRNRLKPGLRTQASPTKSVSTPRFGVPPSGGREPK